MPQIKFLRLRQTPGGSNAYRSIAKFGRFMRPLWKTLLSSVPESTKNIPVSVAKNLGTKAVRFGSHLLTKAVLDKVKKEEGQSGGATIKAGENSWTSDNRTTPLPRLKKKTRKLTGKGFSKKHKKIKKKKKKKAKKASKKRKKIRAGKGKSKAKAKGRRKVKKASLLGGKKRKKAGRKGGIKSLTSKKSVISIFDPKNLPPTATQE